MQTEWISLQNGEYRFELRTGEHSSTFRFHCLRHGEEWRDFVGDNAVLSLFQYTFESLSKVEKHNLGLPEGVEIGVQE